MTPLNYKAFGDSGPALIILHGLFGSLENWSSQARELSSQFRVFALDLRNHGRSPHRAEMGYTQMAADVLGTMDELKLDRAHIIGHSMGGKTAMQFALDHPERIKKLLVVDIAPREYPPHHNEIFDALENIDLQTIASRKAADSQLTEAVPEEAVRSFLLKNLQRIEHGFSWKMNLRVLRSDYGSIAAAVQSDAPFTGEVLFIKGSESDYITATDKPDIALLFPNARGKTIQGAGHWPHVEKADIFTKIARDFLRGD